jgi:cytochrome c5
MTAIGFSGGSHCGPAHGARLQERGAPLVIDHMHWRPRWQNSSKHQRDDKL